MFEVVLTTDRTMMTDHHGKEFIGFMATGPAIGVPERLWLWACCPKPKVDKLGRPLIAPYGLRKIEAKLQDAGYNAAIVDPDHLGKHLDTMKVLLLSHHDYFAYGPPSSEWWLITGQEPVNRRSFRKLMESPVVREAKKRGVKIIAGGPAAWQWLWELGSWEKWGIDTVVDGEGERVVVDLVEKALRGEELPKYVYVSPREAPRIEEIPPIKGASVNGLVEIMRGCPRGCRFCSVTLRPLRFIPIEKILQEIEVNLKAGIRNVVLHSEDVLLYGADGVKPRPEPLIKLHQEVLKKIPGTIAWAHASLSAIKYSEENYKLISTLMEMLSERQKMLGVEVGIETGSVNLAKKIMPAKALPYKAEEWPEIVKDAFAIMHDNSVIPAATIILGLPEETPDDVLKTAELIDELKSYRSLIVPMFFVPMGALKNMEKFRREAITREHIEVMKACLQHDLYWARDIMSRFYFEGLRYAPLRFFLNSFISYVERKTINIDTVIEEFLKEKTEKETAAIPLQKATGG
jgi:radical SAM superfamily enzyme YgiQ (UPF0313 family)